MAEHYESEAFIYNQVPVRIFNHCYDGTEIFTDLLLSVLPVLIFYLIGQKYIIEGVIAGSVKG